MSSNGRDAISHEDVLRRIYEFLARSGYSSTLRCLQIESRVPFNVSKCPEAELRRSVLEGDWDAVVTRHLDGMLLPRQVTFQLYELIVDECVVDGHAAAAKTLFLNSPIFAEMKSAEPTRHQRLQQLVQSVPAVDWRADEVSLLDSGDRRRALLEQILRVVETGEFRVTLPDLPTCVLKATGTGLGEKKESVTSHDPSRQVMQGRDRLAMALAKCPRSIARKLSFEPTLTTAGGVEAMSSVRLTGSLSTAGGASGNAVAYIDVLLTVSHGGVLRCYDARSFTPVSTPSGSHVDTALSMCIYEHEGRRSCLVGIGFRDGTAKVYDVTLARCTLVRKMAQLHAMGIASCAFVGEVVRAAEGGGESLDPGKCRALMATSSFDGTISIVSVFDPRGAAQTLSNPHPCPASTASNFVITKIQRFGPHHMLSVGFDGWLRFWHVAPSISTQQQQQFVTLQVDKAHKPIDIRTAMRRKVEAAHLVEVSDADLIPKELILLNNNNNGSLAFIGFSGRTAAVVDLLRSTIRSLIHLEGYAFRSASASVDPSSSEGAVVASLFLTSSDGSVHFVPIDSASMLPVIEPAERCTAVPSEAGVLVDDAIAVCAGSCLAVSSFTQKAVYILE